jgi:DNA-directed RNA polymerase subunit M/transcription elongation factor TFIIS
MPLFCPKCGKVMKKNRDQICFFHTKGCLNCHVKEKAERNEEPNIHEFKRKLKIIQNKILEEQENNKK